MAQQPKRLGEYLIETKIISQGQLEEALRLQKKKGGFLGKILLEKGWITDKQFCEAISDALNISWVDLENVLISEEVVSIVPASLAATSQILPLFVKDETLYLAMENPYDTGAIQLIEFSSGMHVKPFIAPPKQLRAMLRKYYQLDDTLIAEPERIEEKNESEQNQAKNVKDSVDAPEIYVSQRKRLGEILLEASLISKRQLDTALLLQKYRSGYLGQILIDMGWVTEEQICWAIGKSLEVSSLRDENLRVSPEIVELVPESMAASCNVFPVFVKYNTLYLAMENPLDIGVIQLIEFSTGMRVEPLVASQSQIKALFENHYPTNEHPKPPTKLQDT